MASTTNTRYTCKDCGFFKDNFCVKKNSQARAIFYACERFQTFEQIKAEAERRRKERMDKEETRLNFIFTGLMIQAISTQMLLEYFDTLFGDIRAERNWRHSRKRAANEIVAAVERIRTLFTHTFQQDQIQVMTGHGTKQFDCDAYDSHEQDARDWTLKLLYHLDRCWQNEEAERLILETYKAMPDNNLLDRNDYEHFAK